jgi:putative DNA primase/helicase
MNAHDVVGQMLAAGLDQPDMPLDLSGKIRRFGPKKVHWYKLHEMRTGDGQYVVVGSFGNWKVGERHRVEVDWKGISQAEREALAAQREAAAQAQALERQQLAERAAMTAAQLWKVADRTGESPYLQRKLVDGEACRYLRDGAIVIPLIRYDLPRDEALKGLQVIHADGAKRFTKGLDKPGTCLRLGHVVVGEPVLICEGYATGLTLRMATERRLPVVVAIDAGNLAHVVRLMRELFPHSPLVICADDDWRTNGNPGRSKAHQAARAVTDTTYFWPVFGPGRGDKDTDFNDLHKREGLNAVRRQLRTVLSALGSEILNAA